MRCREGAPAPSRHRIRVSRRYCGGGKRDPFFCSGDFIMRRTSRPGDIFLGKDLGATNLGVCAIDLEGRVLLKESVELPSLVSEGPARTIQQFKAAGDLALRQLGKTWDNVLGIG